MCIRTMTFSRYRRTLRYKPQKQKHRSFANLIAAIVSAVSPDCDIAITTSLLFIIGFLYLNSDIPLQQVFSKTLQNIFSN
jgi:hypothetical protein